MTIEAANIGKAAARQALLKELQSPVATHIRRSRAAESGDIKTQRLICARERRKLLKMLVAVGFTPAQITKRRRGR